MGGFAHVVRATREHDQQVFALKRSNDRLEEKEQRAAFYKEIRLMKENPHPFIVRVIDDFLEYSGHLCMVQELYD